MVVYPRVGIYDRKMVLYPRVGIYDLEVVVYSAHMTSWWSYIDLEVVVYSAVAGAVDHPLREVDSREVRGEVLEERPAQPRPASRVHNLFGANVFLHVLIKHVLHLSIKHVLHLLII